MRYISITFGIQCRQYSLVDRTICFCTLQLCSLLHSLAISRKFQGDRPSNGRMKIIVRPRAGAREIIYWDRAFFVKWAENITKSREQTLNVWWAMRCQTRESRCVLVSRFLPRFSLWAQLSVKLGKTWKISRRFCNLFSN